MPEDQALATANFNQLPSTQLGSDDAFEELSRGGEYLGRVQLFSNNKEVKAGLIMAGHWGIPESAEEVTDLGTSVDILPLARRPKAMDFNDKDTIISNYDMTSEEFQRIADASMGANSGCAYGPSFLVIERSTGRFLEFFCGSKSTRTEAKKIYSSLPLTEQDIAARKLNTQPHGPLPLTLKIKLVTKGKNSWHVPVVTKCSTPFQNLPPLGKFFKEIERFVNPQADNLEKVDEQDAAKRRAR